MNYSQWLSCLHTTTHRDRFASIQPLTMAILSPYNHSPWPSCPHTSPYIHSPEPPCLHTNMNYSQWLSCLHITTHHDRFASIQPLTMAILSPIQPRTTTILSPYIPIHPLTGTALPPYKHELLTMAVLSPYNHSPWPFCLHTTTHHDHPVPIQPLPMAILPPYNHGPWLSCLHTTTHHDPLVPMGLLPDTLNCGLRIAPGMPRTFSPPPQVSGPNMHHGTCVTQRFPLKLVAGKTFPAHAQPVILHIY